MGAEIESGIELLWPSMLAALAISLMRGIDMAFLAAPAVGARAIRCFTQFGTERRLFRAAFLLRDT
ncbi:queuine/archaeosine tRNA-ribosyltransferase [Rhizobium leguminosarum]